MEKHKHSCFTWEVMMEEKEPLLPRSKHKQRRRREIKR